MPELCDEAQSRKLHRWKRLLQLPGRPRSPHLEGGVGVAAAFATAADAAKVASGKGSGGGSSGEAKPLSCLVGSRALRLAVACAIALGVLLALVGTFLVSFVFEVDGIAVEFLYGRHVSKEYSLLSVGTSVAQDRYDNAGLLGLEIVFLALAVVVPILELCVLLGLWMAPMRPLTQRAVLHFCYLLDSWASLDVAALVLVIATSEFGRMAEFLVYKSGFATPCTMIKDLTASECLEVNMHARGCMAIVISAGLLLLVVPKVTLRLCADAISQRMGYPVLPKEVASDDPVKGGGGNSGGGAANADDAVDGSGPEGEKERNPDEGDDDVPEAVM
mmetsp:Transcript_618/g.1581  ORF Transcript_618/g.1581 Transcript_618/m.1581 type:complete len:332 (+) Transcript_618:673-1668(+)